MMFLVEAQTAGKRESWSCEVPVDVVDAEEGGDDDGGLTTYRAG